MEQKIRQLKGSPFSDAVKQWHKTLGDRLYAVDLDLLMISFNPNDIKACLDIKRPDDNYIGDSHQCAYDWLEDRHVPVYCITPLDFTVTKCSECGRDDYVIHPNSRVKVMRYCDGLAKIMTREEYIEWESKRRR